MTEQEILDKLNSDEWEHLSPLEMDSLYDWIKLAATQRATIISRIQNILVSARLITDEVFIECVSKLKIALITIRIEV